jgi:acyl carrier protein
VNVFLKSWLSVADEAHISHDAETLKRAAREAIATVARRPVSDEECVVSTGIVDSLSVLKLIVILEKQLQIQIPREQVQPEDFDSIEIILETLERVAA